MFRLRFSNRFKADTKKIVSIDEYLSLSMKEAKKCKVQPKTNEELINVVNKAVDEFGNDADLNFIDTYHITDMSDVFSENYGPVDFNGDISKWDTSNVTDMSYMFYLNGKFNGNISNWNVSKVRNMTSMFKATHFRGDLSKWNISPDCDTSDMFMDCPLDDEYGENAEVLKGGSESFSEDDIIGILKRIESHMRKKYSSKFKLGSFKKQFLDSDYGGLSFMIQDDKYADRISELIHDYYESLGDKVEDGPVFLNVDLYIDSHDFLSGVVLSLMPEMDNKLGDDFAPYEEDLEENRLKEKGYIEGKLDELVKQLDAEFNARS